MKKKEVYFLKSDKGNSVVIVDKIDYIERMETLISEGPYVKVRNPLNKWTKTSKTKVLRINEIFPKTTFYEFRNPNPIIPKIHALPKIHKTGNKMRPIVPKNNSPTELIAKFLVKQFNDLSQPAGFSIRNNSEFLDEVKNEEIYEDECLVSFDVCSLFPSVPIQITLQLLEDWLMRCEVEMDKIELFVELTEFCLSENYFQFGGQIDGLFSNYYYYLCLTLKLNSLNLNLSSCLVSIYG